MKRDARLRTRFEHERDLFFELPFSARLSLVLMSAPRTRLD